jgi:hypothetical protein
MAQVQCELRIKGSRKRFDNYPKEMWEQER